MTAHGSQGQTLAAAIVDLLLGRGVSAIASYVAFTRVRTRGDMLIYRKFDRQPFLQGDPEGPALLLRKLRGEEIDWLAVERKHTPQTRCHGPCLRSNCLKDEFSAYEWKNRIDAYCKVCEKRMVDDGNPHRCTKCRQWCNKEHFAPWMVVRCRKEQYICAKCHTNTRLCCYCNKEKAESEFPASRWEQVLVRRMCIQCGKERRCNDCGRTAQRHHFSLEEWEKPDARRKCRDCIPQQCPKCRKSKTKAGFSKEQWKLPVSVGVCTACDTRRCTNCNKEKGCKAFLKEIGSLPADHRVAMCKVCTDRGSQKGQWRCIVSVCRQQYPKEDFTLASEDYGEEKLKKGGTYRVCDTCMQARRAAAHAIRASNSEHVVKYRKVSQ